jgi:Cu/Ag efflux pump CusA
MLRLRRSTTGYLALGLLAVAMFGAYVLLRDRSPAPAPTVLPPNQPAQKDHPVIVEVVALYAGASAEEVEQQLTIPLEATFAGTPRLRSIRDKSAAGSSAMHLVFEPGTDYSTARQEVINRLQTGPPLPPGVTPQLCLQTGGEALRYRLVAPRDEFGRSIYTLNDLRALQETYLEREFRRVPGVADVCASGGTIKRFDIQPDPNRLHRYGVTLKQLADAVAQSNVNGQADLLIQGPATLNVRTVGLFGSGVDPLSADVLTAANPTAAARLFRDAEQRRLAEIRSVTISTVNMRPIRVEDIADGGRLAPGELVGKRGVIVTHQPRCDRVMASGPEVDEDSDAVAGVILLRTGEGAQTLHAVEACIRELNTTAGTLLPGVRIEPYCIDGENPDSTLWVYGIFPLNASLDTMVERARTTTELLREFPEVERVVCEVGACGESGSANYLQCFVGLKTGPGRDRVRTASELLTEFNKVLSAKILSVEWLTTTQSPQKMDLAFPGAPAENLLKIVGPDLDDLERLSIPVQAALHRIRGVESVAVYHSMGRTHLEFRVDAEKCKKWGVNPADVSATLAAALGGKTVSQMVEGEKLIDIRVRFPKHLRDSETAILDLPIDITNNAIVPDNPGNVVPRLRGSELPGSGALESTVNPVTNVPRLRVRDVVTPVGKDGQPDPKGTFLRHGAAAIFRENGERVLPVAYSVRGRPVAEVQAEALEKINSLLKLGYRIDR